MNRRLYGSVRPAATATSVFSARRRGQGGGITVDFTLPARIPLVGWLGKGSIMIRKVAAATASILLSFLCTACARAETLVIDSFDYPSERAAQGAWRPSAGSPPMQLVRSNAGRAGAFLCDWNTVDKRVCYDRSIKLDLSRFGRITLWVYADRPETIRAGNIYFESDQGWYVASFNVSQKGWQQIAIDRVAFGLEGSPAGWHKIQTVRLVFWRAAGEQAEKVMVALDQIEAHSAPIVVVRGELTIRRGSPEAPSVSLYAGNVAKLLREAGFNYTVIDDTDVVRGGLAGARIAIFPYNPDMSPEEAEAAARFIAGGGKVMVFYHLPQRLAAVLGVSDAGWTKPSYPGQFASVRLDGRALPGAPQYIQQDSWSIQRPQPLRQEAQIAGQWVNVRGEATGIPAVTVSPAGLYMGHVLTLGDDVAKQRFVLSSIAALAPDWQPALARMALKRTGRVGGFADIADVRRFVESRRGQVPQQRVAEALKLLDKADQLARAAGDRLRRGERGSFGSILAASDEAQQCVLDAIYLSLPTWRPAFRAVWCHSASGVPGWSWDTTIRHLKSCGFNAIVVNMLWAGLAYYPSGLLPAADEVATRGDQLAECLAACRKYGVQLHVWKVNYNLYRAPQGFIDRMRREGRLQADSSGRELTWLSPSHPGNFELEKESMLEVVRRYPVDGIHFDYTRYPHSQADFSLEARKRFEEAKGVTVERWPGDVIYGQHAGAFADWRREQITRLVREVSQEAKKIRPGVKVSAAVYSNGLTCRESIGQDWLAWARWGYVDFVCPMDYTENDLEFAGMLRNQLSLVGRNVPVYPGVGVTASGSNLSPIQAAKQLLLARQLGAQGFILFNYTTPLATRHLPALGKGLLAE